MRENGHDCVIWSNSINYAYVKAKELDLQWQTKFSYGNNNEPWFDLAIEDDRTQTWLSAKRIVWVDELPESKDWFVFMKKLGIIDRFER